MGRVARMGNRTTPHHSTMSNLLGLQGSCILALEETGPGRLADDSSLGGPIVIVTGVAGGGVVAPVDTGGGGGPMRVSGRNTAGLVPRPGIVRQQVSVFHRARRVM